MLNSFFFTTEEPPSRISRKARIALSQRFINRRATFVVFISAVLLAAALLPLMSASCSTQQPRPDEPQAFERLRALTRGGALPAEPIVAQIAAEHAGARAGALARALQARLRLEAKDFAGVASLLDTKDIARHTAIGDHALWMRAEALEKAGRRVEARAAYEQLARDFPDALRAREAVLRAAQLTLDEAQPAAVATFLKKLSDADDPEALLLTARAYEQSGDATRALAAYRRLYFYAPISPANDAEAVAAFGRLNSSTAPANAAEATTRAEKLFRAKRYSESFNAYTDAFARFPETSSPQSQLRRGVAASQARRPDAPAILGAIPTGSDARPEALHTLAQHYARLKQWDMARATLDEMRRAFPQSEWTMRALVAAGQTARDAKNQTEALSLFRLAAQSFPGAAEVAGAQFEVAWAAHEANNFAESSRLLVEHLAAYADKNTDNRGRAGYWAARDTERAGRLAEARALYEAMLVRYDANWYGHLARERLDVLKRSGAVIPPTSFAPDSPVARAVANLRPVFVPEETAGAAEDARALKADQLNAVGLDDLAHAELDKALESAPQSPRLNLAKAKIYRARTDNVQAFNVLRRSFPDYSQMEPEELTREEWDIFYPLAHWDVITQEARARSLDPYTVAGLIRQESVFNPRAASSANAYGLMQLLIPTARLTAKRYGVEQGISVETLFDPRLNVQLGTAYLRDQMDKFGRIEYVAAAYNAGPGRAVAWRASLPLPIDEWAEAIPFRETRGYVQGVVRNTLQYRRLYDEQGRFRPEVGARANRPTPTGAATPVNARPRRASSNEEE
jgi:soluble lytic murein transglycosylase